MVNISTEFWVTCVSYYICDLQQQQQLLAVMQFQEKKLICSLHLCCLLHLLHLLRCYTSSSVCLEQPFLPPACVITVHPRGHGAGHAEVKVSISPEPGPLSHLLLPNCGKSAGQRRTDHLVGRTVILFQTWCVYQTSCPNVTLTLNRFHWCCWTGCHVVVWQIGSLKKNVLR